MRLLDEKSPEVKAANGRLLGALHASLGQALLDECARLHGAASAHRLRAQIPSQQ